MVTATLALAVLLTSLAPAWSVNPNNTLVWDGRPYLPVGLRIPGTPEEIAAANADGIKDVIVDLPAGGAGWDGAIQALEANGMRYMVAISSLAPSPTGIAVEPEGYRVSGITEKTTVTMPIPESHVALALLATTRDGSIRWHKRVDIVDGLLTIEVDAGTSLEHTLLVFPVVHDLRTPDYWEGFDKHRDALLASLKVQKLGAGLRGIVNPLGAVVRFPSDTTQFVPTSRLFQVELETFLTQKYLSLPTALRAWGIGPNDIESFSHLARLVPLWSESRGVGNLWDPASDRLYICNQASSAAWRDIRDTMKITAERRMNRLLAAIREVAPVPVIQEWTGWVGPYSSRSGPLSGIGIVGEAESIDEVVELASRPSGSLFRWSSPGVSAATGIALAPGVSIEESVRELEGMGVRAWYFKASSPDQRRAVAREAAARVRDTSASEWRPQVLFYPESARDPAFPTRVSGNVWWLPSPDSGERLDLGTSFRGYRHVGPSGSFTAIWSLGGEARAQLRISDPKKATYWSVDGAKIESRLRKDITELSVPYTPMIVRDVDDVPIPVAAFEETAAMVSAIIQNFGSGISTARDEEYLLADAVRGFERSPAGSYFTLRSQLHRLVPRGAPYIWIEAERPAQHNMSELQRVPGSAGGMTLDVSSPIPPPRDGFTALYPAVPRVPATLDVWVAMKIVKRHLPRVEVRVGDTVLTSTEPPTATYGPGYAWYKFGQAAMPQGGVPVRLTFRPDGPAEASFDAIMLCPPSSRPSGAFPPLDWLRPAPAGGAKPAGTG